MKRLLFYVSCVLLLNCMLTACEESEDEENEFADWKNRNELFFNNQYTYAKEMIGQGDDSWRLYLKWSLNESQGHTPKDYIVVKVLEEGKGNISPLYTDHVEVYIQGKLIPSTSFPNGYIFYNSYNDNNMNPNTASSVWLSADGEDYALTGVKGKYIDGLATALMYMHLGDHWQVYVPYALAYDGASQQELKIPAYSTLIYDIKLLSIKRQ